MNRKAKNKTNPAQLLESIRQSIIGAAKTISPKKGLITLMVLITAAAITFTACPPGGPDITNPETRDIILTISRNGNPLPGIPVTLEEGKDVSGNFAWLPAYQNAESFSMRVEGNTASFKKDRTTFTLNITGDPSGTKMSKADWEKLEKAINEGFATIDGMNVTTDATVAPSVDRVEEYPQQRDITITIANGGPTLTLTGVLEGTDRIGNFDITSQNMGSIKNWETDVTVNNFEPYPAGKNTTIIIGFNGVNITLPAGDYEKLEEMLPGIVNAINSKFDEKNINAQVGSIGNGITKSDRTVDVIIGGINAKFDTVDHVLHIGSDSSKYADPATIGPISITDTETINLLKGENVTLEFSTNAPADISLAHVHYLRQAILGLGAGTEIAGVDETGPFTPVFKGNDWYAYESWPPSNDRNLYSSYQSNGKITLMDGIEVVGSDGKYNIEYNRPLKVQDLIYCREDNSTAPFSGFGIKVSGSSAPLQSYSGNWGDVNIGSGESGNVTLMVAIDNPLEYYNALKAAGLLPTRDPGGVVTGPTPKHNVNITAPAAPDNNIAANGIYDLILGYFNPKSDDGVVGDDLKDRLPTFSGSWVFDGLMPDGSGGFVAARPAGVTGRHIGNTVMYTQTDRKITPTTPGVGQNGRLVGLPNDIFIGNLTVPMANHLRSIGVTEFRNTNIIGNGNKWDSYVAAQNDIVLPPVTNVGLNGDYNDLMVNDRTGGKIRGVLDIVGRAPSTLSNDSINGYLNLWNISGDMGINRFYVVSINDLNGINKVNVGNPWSTNAEFANVIIYPKKYAVTEINNERPNLQPNYRAFLDGANAQSGTPRVMPVLASFSGAASYKGRITAEGGAPAVYPLDEESWIDAANANNGAAPTTTSYATLKANNQLLNDTTFGNIVASIAPVRSGAQLAGAGRQRLEAVLPSSVIPASEPDHSRVVRSSARAGIQVKKRPSWEEAFLDSLWKENLRLL